VKPLTLTFYLARTTAKFNVWTTEETNDRGTPVATLYLDKGKTGRQAPAKIEASIADPEHDG